MKRANTTVVVKPLLLGILSVFLGDFEVNKV